MKQIVLVTLMVLYFAPTSRCQTVTVDTVSPTSGCHSLFTYDNGLNLRISVLTATKDSAMELERTIAKDISRFKDTRQISTSNDPVLPIGQRPIEFEATIFWSELQVGGKTAGYAAAAFFTETYAILGNGRATGFSTQILATEDLYVQPTKEKMLDYLEKALYDGLIAEVKSRRAAAKISGRMLFNSRCQTPICKSNVPILALEGGENGGNRRLSADVVTFCLCVFVGLVPC